MSVYRGGAEVVGIHLDSCLAGGIMQREHKRSVAQCGSFQNRIFEGNALGIVLRKPGFRGVGIREDL